MVMERILKSLIKVQSINLDQCAGHGQGQSQSEDSMAMGVSTILLIGHYIFIEWCHDVGDLALDHHIIALTSFLTPLFICEVETNYQLFSQRPVSIFPFTIKWHAVQRVFMFYLLDSNSASILWYSILQDTYVIIICLDSFAVLDFYYTLNVSEQ